MPIQNSEQIDTYYDALVRRDPEYLGIFFVGVKTTGIFCLSTCRARKPLKKNVEFFPDLPEVLQHGYRPCKICRPTENAHEAPEDVQSALQLVQAAEFQKVSDADLREAGLAPERIRRWFKQHHGVTFQAYQRMLRVNRAYQDLKSGGSVSASAFDQGYESLSGFAYTYQKILGRNPSAADAPAPIVLSRITTPLGPMFIGATEEGICLLEFTDRRMLETEFKDLQRRLQTRIIAGSNAHSRQLERELGEYFEGKRQHFEVALDTPGTDFQQMVWEGLQDIPYGTTRSYQAQATHLGRPKAVRAVASANGHNRVSIVVPCHRVIGKDGNLTGYGGGLPRKRWLLDHEAKFRR